ncbi:ATP-binding cassette domain-containing protein [Rhizobium sp. TRM95796]|uniref:ATP-binding cassette domain-containing protein n=1 Tax=Rhizobium sp. TRM95796 TaxID=2979862 RepID=UPI0021E92C1B|nr:ATP-binding cassette domain-containing protein [Rhizobium sp. TRM95796]MCV3767291.1 ATP-binding cassette domain-containing protein [Rhizobium sp. TRM95796]
MVDFGKDSLDLKIDDLGISFGARNFRYRLHIEGPGVVAVTGPSGAGKSTLFHLLAGFETPERGRIVLNGVDVTHLPPGRRPLTYVFQEHNLFAHLSLFDNVALGISPALRLDAAARAEVSAAFEAVGLAGFERRKPADLSGGEKQRAAFARALLRKRPLLLLDEPFASLDERLRREMGDLVRSMQRSAAMIVMMITHDRSEIMTIADRVVGIDHGAIAFAGSAAEWTKTGEITDKAASSLKFD